MASNQREEEEMDFVNQDHSKELSQAAKEEVLLTLSLKWLDKNKKKTDLQKVLQTWFSKCEPKIDCTVRKPLPDDRAVIVVSPPPGLQELQKLSGETLYTKDKKSEKKLEKELVTILSVMVGTPKLDPQTADDASVNLTPPAASVNTNNAESEPPAGKATVEEQKKSISTAGDTPAENQTMDENCLLSVTQFLYVSHIFKDKLQRIQEENEVEIKSEVIVKFESKSKDGKPNEAKTKFIDLVQESLANFGGSVFSPSSADPDQLNRALKVIMNKENKLLANMSSEEITVFGPNGQRTVLDLMLKPSHKTFTEESERRSLSSNFSGDVLVKINMTIKDDLADEGLAIDKNQWKNLKSTYDNHLRVIKSKFNVDFKESSISEDKVNVKPSYKGHGGNAAMESHAVRALLRLYQKMMTSPMSLPPPYRATWFSGSEDNFTGPGVNGHSKQNNKESAGGGATGDSKDDKCSICLSDFTNKKQLKCKHAFCEECFQNALKACGPICPICKDVFGVMKGNQPDGKMTWNTYPSSLPGFTDCGYICITYDIPSGKQTENHPNPGQFYGGTIRHAYLPDNKEGNEVLLLLKKAFDQKLIFTVGASRTTGAENMVTWNDIHHKTSISGGPQLYGYPDENYLSRVKEELKAKGIQ
ncbi:uncharacterized protein LOC122834485 [Gambusia affinis]|uniref:uncharacterized protein LOC122834485 n=1 Tax=Gambusia affinis TaxID=33528 RepID=UPI001CDD5062|nr:uncharacterized protein LOC122834485 [Gambusia affinis]XP_043978907.1 uncharacterized protein LOC122834485 [Gambusia affinis]XP_043978908.1 uncharacterized protein LOC122834485 [Gambusia affinis]XP_043978909.1 uncharacterized protein LOC122834485 [Gambusia affinis]